MLGSSLPFPAGLSSISFSSTISSVISTFPCKFFKNKALNRIPQKNTHLKNITNKCAGDMNIHQVQVFHPAQLHMATSLAQTSGRRVRWAVMPSVLAASSGCTFLGSLQEGWDSVSPAQLTLQHKICTRLSVTKLQSICYSSWLFLRHFLQNLEYCFT